MIIHNMLLFLYFECYKSHNIWYFSIRQTMYFSPCRIMLTTISFCDVVYFFSLTLLCLISWCHLETGLSTMAKKEKLIRFPEVEREIGNMAMWCGCIPLALRSVRHVSSTSVDLRLWKSRRLWGLKRVKLGSRRLSAVFLLWSKASGRNQPVPYFCSGPH